jgi:hypothetical protein
MRILALATLSLALASGPALAQDGGFYLGAGVGQFNLEVDELDDVDLGDTFDGDDTSMKLFGGWRFNPYIAVELAYIDYGAPDEDFDLGGGDVVNLEAEITGFEPSVVATLPLGIFELFAKVGYVFYDFEITASFDGESESVDDSDEDLTYGVGAGVVLGDHFNARLSYEIVDVADTEDANAIWLTGAWRF